MRVSFHIVPSFMKPRRESLCVRVPSCAFLRELRLRIPCLSTASSTCGQYRTAHRSVRA
jgi:hypothetical protein